VKNYLGSLYSSIPVTPQHIADQRRAIIRNAFISNVMLDKIKNDVEKEIMEMKTRQ